MRHVLMGALGAALVYPAVWYALTPDRPVAATGVPQRAAVATARPAARREQVHVAELEREALTRSRATVASQPLDTERPALQQRPTLEELPMALGAPVEPALPALPAVGEPGAPSVAFTDVRAALGRMSELQAHAHDPNELARRVQTMDQDPEQLARLKALAEMFVQLPPSRLEPYMPAREGGSIGSR